MAAIDTIDQVIQEWDDSKIKLQNKSAEEQSAKFGPWTKLIAQRQALFAERWKPERIKVLKKLGNTKDASADAVKGTLTPLAREEFVHDLRNYGVPDKYAVPAGSLVEVK
jgi:hypothetical protein